jgi:Raf kinase inhibitor-like YbhB/YbcL family protein
VGSGRAVVAAALAAVALAGCGGGDDDAKKSDLPAAPDTISFSSPAFKDGGAIPVANTCDGAGTAPTIIWRALPPGSVELVMVVEDTDAKDGPFTHWTVWRIAASTGAGLAPDGKFPAGFLEGKNSAGKAGWTPPCPPEGDDAHHYTFSLYALPKGTSLEAGAEPAAVRALLKDPLGRGTFTGTYKRSTE